MKKFSITTYAIFTLSQYERTQSQKLHMIKINGYKAV